MGSINIDNIEEVFKDIIEDEEQGMDIDEILSMLRNDDLEEATNVEDELDYNEGWYNYSTVTFDYKGKRYSIDYKEHTSDNVCDMEFLFDSFDCLGEVTEMDKSISGEELARISFGYERQLERQLGELNKYKDLLGILNPISKKQLKEIGDLFLKADEEENKTVDIGAIGRFLTELSKG